MISLDADAVRAALRFEVLIPALRQAFRDGAQVPRRHSHAISSKGQTGTSLLMPAWNDSGYYGVKIVNIFPRNAELGLPGLHSVYLLYDARTGVPLAQIDGNEITSRRTAAAAALAASFLARPDARSLFVLGTGRVARLLPAAFRAVRPIERVAVWNRRSASAHAFAQTLRDDGFDALATDNLSAASAGADLISCATLATEPLMQGVWLRPGVHLDLIGSFTPAMKEAAPDCFAGAQTFVDTDEAPAKAGDLLDAFAAGSLTRESIVATLAELCRGHHAGRLERDQVTIFKAVGTALEDLAAASLVYEMHRR